jgi:hypothetical protein
LLYNSPRTAPNAVHLVASQTPKHQPEAFPPPGAARQSTYPAQSFCAEIFLLSFRLFRWLALLFYAVAWHFLCPALYYITKENNDF